MPDINPQALYRAGQYFDAIQQYEAAIQQDPDNKAHYWYLGLVLLLSGQPEDADSAWLMGMFGGDDADIEQWQQDLLGILNHEAFHQEINGDMQQAVKLREQIQVLFPNRIDSHLQSLRLNLQTEQYCSPQLDQAPLADLLQTHHGPFDHLLFMAVIQELLNRDPGHPQILAIVEASLPYFIETEQAKTYGDLLGQAAKNIGYLQNMPDLAAQICEQGLKVDSLNTELTASRAEFYQNSDQYQKGIEAARHHLSLVTTLADRIDALKTLLKAVVITGGKWDESTEVFRTQETLLKELVTTQPQDLSLEQISRLFNSYFFAPCFQDAPAHKHRLQQQITQVCAANTARHTPQRQARYRQGHRDRIQTRDPQRKLRIGYLSYCLRRHSVGWLARALFQHCDRDKYDTYAYLMAMPDHHEPLQDWYVSQVKQAFKATDVSSLADAIFDDEIDILIELDSITVDTVCSVVILKPAPIQVTWLGWDASGIPTIDYFIADNHVLPEDAQDYYQEKIVRLPHSYIACDGFEVGLPTVRREDLGVPTDAIAFYSVQKGYKRHPDTMRLQLEIIKNVPGSYFLIKGSNDTEAMEKAFLALADDVGVERDRLKFLGVDFAEANHRTNMLLADIILDTYPYNGATTTMETLWMGIPLITRVGQQFAARNSYTMMLNAGITEGIAHNAAEYVDWGVRLGTDTKLRQQVMLKLREARRSAPLWNGRQFARNMEAAYDQMWVDYVAANLPESDR
jgi:predicted O-linked N-acetylglucosamine transferase (SPINDLY family)